MVLRLGYFLLFRFKFAFVFFLNIISDYWFQLMSLDYLIRPGILGGIFCVFRLELAGVFMKKESFDDASWHQFFFYL